MASKIIYEINGIEREGLLTENFILMLVGEQANQRKEDFQFVKDLENLRPSIKIQGTNYELIQVKVVNEEYFLRFQQLQSLIAYQYIQKTQNFCFVLAQIRTPTQNKLSRFTSIQYGQELFFEKKPFGYISNWFNIFDLDFYIFSTENSFRQCILEDRNGNLIGFALQYMGINLIVPFGYLFYKKTVFEIYEPLIPYLQRICHVQIQGSYCTGILLNTNTIITARHLLKSQSQSQEVRVRLYPYNVETKGIVKRIYDIDVIEIQIAKVEVPQCKIKKKCKLAQNVIALGFGKFSFKLVDQFKFMPTLEKGMVAKIINFNDKNIYVKTTANLYNGFSGSGIWSESEQLLGMAIFIIKKGQKSLTYHNYSFLMQFLEEFAQKYKILDFVRKFENITTRGYMPKF